MSAPVTPVSGADELVHGIDPGDWSWSESWYFSWIDLDGGPAGFFRVGILPNQQRAMLWCFVHVDGAWFGVEESRLAFDDFDLSGGVAYDKWALRFAWRPEVPLVDAHFTVDGTFLTRSGPDAGAHVAVSIDLACRSTGVCVGTGTGDDAFRSAYQDGRFEQPFEATGAVVVGGRRQTIRAGAHRDRSWGPREWRQTFTLGDIQSEDRQLYFVGRSFPGLGGGFLRNGSDSLRHLVCVDGSIEYDDRRRTIATGRLSFEGGEGDRIEVTLEPIAPSVDFDMAHTCEPPEHWLYWRTLVEAHVTGWDGPCRGWLEANRYGLA